MAAWTYTPEVRILMHLYNKLVQKGYIKTPIDTFEFLLKEFSSDFFADGQRPTSNFEPCLTASMRKLDRDRAGSAGQFSSLRAFCFNGDWFSQADLHINLSRKSMLAFRKKLLTHHLRAADWNVERVLDDDLPIRSTLAWMRFCHNLYLAPNDLSSRNRQILDLVCAAGKTKAEVSEMAAFLSGNKSKQAPSLPESGEYADERAQRHAIANSLTGEETLRMVGIDVKREIDGVNCLLNVNYLEIAMQLRRRYCEMIEALGDLKNPLYEAAFGSSATKPRAIARPWPGWR
ncbi:uncharacterized protein LMH87_009158 [Akanthomyces muscarius]|uniref:Uncharacterized protein n=1 Tax=Akanthomyces muscarius TaxID=2231603 RepID=A0A9W8QKN4_AKAMU|nr:uncharacterized protein LMH87_009158 [Akanthomyces muscarius]KAJ4158642.1 hypothetical protein LMH87_009158 [Akanthomyces muscarius]